jgi:hypothetical protein
MRDVLQTGRRLFWQVAPVMTMLLILGLDLFGDDGRGIKWSWL